MPDWTNHKLNQNCWGKYQQSQICRWYHPNGREQKGIKESFDESERGEWKSWPKTQHSKNKDHGIQSHHIMANRCGKMEIVTDFISSGSKITVDGDCSHEIKRCLLLGRKAMTYLDSILKSRDIALPTKVHLVKTLVFPVVIYGCEYWALKNWCFSTVVLEKTFESSLDCKEFQPVNPKGNQSWIFVRRTDAKAEAPIPWPPDAKKTKQNKKKNWLIGKDPNAGKFEGKRRRGRQRMRWLDGKTDSMDMLLLLSHFSRVQLCVTPYMAAHQAPSSLGFSRQEQWSGLTFPSPMHESEKGKWSCSVMSNS